MCCGNADNTTACCSDGSGFAWNGAALLGFAQVQANSTGQSSSTGTLSPVSTVTVFASSTGSSAAQQQCSTEKMALGAGLGIPLAVSLLMAVALGIILLRRKKSQRPVFQSTVSYRSEMTDPGMPVNSPHAELPQHTDPYASQKLEGTYVVHQPRVELPGVR